MSRYLNSYIIYTLLVVLAFGSLNSKELINTSSNYKFGVGFNYSAISTYYDNEGNLQSKYPKIKTITFDNDGTDSSFTVEGNINIDYVEFHNNYYGEYKLGDNLIGRLGVDIAYYSIDNSYSFNDTIRDENGNIKYDKFDNALYQSVSIDDYKSSIFRLMYFTPSLEYYLINNDKTILTGSLGFQLPLSFNERKLKDDNNFLGDGYLQVNAGMRYRAKYETTEFELGARYLKRSEIYNDLANVNLTVFLTKVEDAYFYIKADYYSGLGVGLDEELVITEFPYSESYLNTTFGLNVFFEDLELQFDYTFVPYGENYWLQNRINSSFHYYIK